MSLHFDIKEFQNRLNRLLELMAENYLDGMLLFRQKYVMLGEVRSFCVKDERLSFFLCT